MIRTRRTIHRAGFTLIESLIASVLLAMVVSAALLPLTAGMQNDQYAGRRAEAVTLGQDLMEEILAQPFYDPETPTQMVPGPDPGEDRREEFDNIDDYHGFSETPGAIQPYQELAEATDVSDALSRTVTVEYVHLTGQDGSQAANVCRVIVEVSDDGGVLTRLSRLVYGDSEGR